jgi:hypothetical protein
MSKRDLPSSRPFVFPEDSLFLFVDSLLAVGPAGKSQLSVSTIFDYMSAIRTCFLQAGVSFVWPEVAYRLVKGEGSRRRRVGLDTSSIKRPFPPRVAMILERHLASIGRSWEEQAAAGAVLLCFYFGWRSSTI